MIEVEAFVEAQGCLMGPKCPLPSGLASVQNTCLGHGLNLPSCMGHLSSLQRLHATSHLMSHLSHL